MPRKQPERHSALEYFQVDAATGLPVASPATRPEPGRAHPTSERIERVSPRQMLPDRFQPRRLLPASIRAAFYSGQIDCYEAAASWLALAKSDAGHHAEVERLLAMGGTFSEHGQIKPITGSWITGRDGREVFLIETGERRFWAACLQHCTGQAAEEPELRVEVVAKPTRQRQVLENRHAEPPSSVSQACEVAALILAELEQKPDPAINDEYDYFRQARSQRMPAGLWERITPVMQLTRPRMVQLLNILQMPTPLLDLANRFRLPERVLREVLAQPPEQWENLIHASIQNSLTSDEVARLTPEAAHPAAGAPTTLPVEPSRQAAAGLRRFELVLGRLDEFGRSQALDEIADSVVVGGQAAALLDALDELGRLVRARLERRTDS